MILFFKHVIFLIALLSSLTLVHAVPIATFLSVPFSNVNLNPNDTIQGSYSFGINPLIFCYENNLQSVGIVTWPYKGALSSSALSVSLKTSASYEGQFADSNGTITVTNNQSTPLIVSCQFAL